MKIKIGETVMLKPNVDCSRTCYSVDDPKPATIVYINLPHRFFTAEFHFPGGGHFRESFKFVLREDLACRTV